MPSLRTKRVLTYASVALTDQAAPQAPVRLSTTVHVSLSHKCFFQAYYVLSVDRTAVTVTFSNYYADAGPGVSVNSSKENSRPCRMAVSSNAPWADLHNRSPLPRTGGTALLRSVFAFQEVSPLALLPWTIVDTIS